MRDELTPAARAGAGAARRVLVSDFDGTMTRYDFYDLVRQQWPVPPENDPWDRYVAHQITHFEALAEIFARIRTDERTLRALVDRMELDPGLPAAVDGLRGRGWEVVVASAGCAWYIDILLGRAGVRLTVHSNPGVFSEAEGLRVELPLRSPFLSRPTGIDKLGVVRAAQQQGAEVAFAGDGRPDWDSALSVAPELRFARGWLAEALRAAGHSFHPFERWSEIAQVLLAREVSCAR